MYTQDFYISDPVGNNAFSLTERKNKKLFVPKLKKIQSFDEIKLLKSSSSPHNTSPSTPLLTGERSASIGAQDNEKVTFEEFDFDGVMQTCYGLENLYELEYNLYSRNTSPSIPLLTGEGSKKITLYLVDNHNHVYYFWYLARQQGIISDGAKLYHIDAHADMRDPAKCLFKPDSQDMQQVFEYTNFQLNVGNFIVPAMKEGLIGEVVQIRGERALLTHLGISSLNSNGGELQTGAPLRLKGSCHEVTEGLDKKQSIILDLDLDFFAPEMEYIDFGLAKKVILAIAQRADLITICTSPYFIEQERAINYLKKIFD